MSKTGQWVFEMQEDAQWMSREVFIRKHGVANASFYDECQEPQDYPEPDFEAQEQGYYG